MSDVDPSTKIELEPMYHVFASTMRAISWLGLGIMVLFGLLYLFRVLPASVPAARCLAHWEAPVDQFWTEVRGMPVDGYDWFLGSMSATDGLTVFGVAVLALCPAVSVLIAMFRAPWVYVWIMLVLLAEFAFAVARPVLMGGS